MTATHYPAVHCEDFLSAFVVIFERTGEPVDPSLLDKVMSRLEHRGPDGRDDYIAGHLAMGHWHFWTTPEDVGERQPLKMDGFPFVMVMDGRIDNRAELLSRLHIDPEQGCGLSDAIVVLHSYAKWGESCFEWFVGEFALVIFDQTRGELVCVRDHLGDRTLCYSFQGTRVVIGSEPWAVAGANDLVEVHEGAIAHYFSFKAPVNGQTLFKNVIELLPAHLMKVCPNSERVWQFWEPGLKKWRGKSDVEYAEQFLSLLEESVRCRLRANTQPAVLMSGGLDSTSLASIAAPMLAPSQLTTFSYVFDELPDCDERVFINAVKNSWGIRSVQIPCDDLWPLRDWENWPQNPNYPSGNAYLPIRKRVYTRSQQEGFRVLLTGDFGDHLYIDSEDWLADLLLEGRFNKIGEEFSYQARHTGLRNTLTANYMRRLARRVLDGLLIGKYLHRKQLPSPWLMPTSISALLEMDAASELQGEMIGRWTALGSSMSVFNASYPGVELRYPYRDRRLVQFMLSLPAHQFYSKGLYRPVLRNAMKGLLPEVVRTRPGKTGLYSLFFRGMDREKNTLQDCIQDPQAAWRQFVRFEWLMERWDAIFKAEETGPEKVVPWLCIAYNAWFQYIFSNRKL